MKLSARNQLKGKIVEVKKGATTTPIRPRRRQHHHRLDHRRVGGELGLAAGKTAYAIIKASSVMVGVD
jgi:molybdopterin-binding protein